MPTPKEVGKAMESLTPEQQTKIEPMRQYIERADEELDPELAEHLDETGGFTSIRHPLVYSVMHVPQMNCMVNDQLRQKREALERSVAEENWPRVVWLHERPHRLTAFVDIVEKFNDVEYWSTLGDIWTDSENIWQLEPLWRECLGANRPCRDHMMEESDKYGFDRSAFYALPEEVTIYRGFDRDGRNKGLSWSLNPKIARWFSQRLYVPGPGVGVPSVVEARVEKEHVIAYFNGRSEEEVVLLPENATIVNISEFDPDEPVSRPELEKGDL